MCGRLCSDKALASQGHSTKGSGTGSMSAKTWKRMSVKLPVHAKHIFMKLAELNYIMKLKNRVLGIDGDGIIYK